MVTVLEEGLAVSGNVHNTNSADDDHIDLKSSMDELSQSRNQ